MFCAKPTVYPDFYAFVERKGAIFMRSEVIILLDSMKRLPQKLHETESLDINYLKQLLEKSNFRVTTMTYNTFLENINTIDCGKNIFLYASSQYKQYKDYIEDILLYIVNAGGKIIPNFHLFRSHENKSYQEFYKYQRNIKSPKFNIVGTYEEGLRIFENADYPIIGKTVDGFGSRGVRQINNIIEGKKFIKKNMSSGVHLNAAGLRNFARRFKYKNQYPRKRGKILLQEKINDVNHDWKILIFGNDYFCLKRSVRKNDFRASGSGNFDFEAVPSNIVLGFAYDVKNKLDTPWVSLDIIEKGENCYLIEYQALHFGLSTLINNRYLYEYDENKNDWTKKLKENECEFYFAKALKYYCS